MFIQRAMLVLTNLLLLLTMYSCSRLVAMIISFYT